MMASGAELFDATILKQVNCSLGLVLIDSLVIFVSISEISLMVCDFTIILRKIPDCP